MSTAPATDENQLQKAIEQLYESEELTDALTDEAATILLSWGEEQLKSLANLGRGQTDLEHTAHQLRRVIRSINGLVERQSELSEIELLQRLIRLVERAMQFAVQKSTIERGSKDDEET